MLIVSGRVGELVRALSAPRAASNELALACSLALRVLPCRGLRVALVLLAGDRRPARADGARRARSTTGSPIRPRRRSCASACETAQRIREFASRELGAAATTAATPPTPSSTARTWCGTCTPRRASRSRRRQECFPFTGCVSYRGFFSEADARRHADALREEGYDVYVGGVPAYSTLGWFDDPLLSTFIRYPDAQLARLVFHELAHQLVYAKDDTTFNESFAVTVEEEGVRRWLEAGGARQRARRVPRRAGCAGASSPRAWRRRASASPASTRRTFRSEAMLARKARRVGAAARATIRRRAGRAEQRLPRLDRALHRAGAGSSSACSPAAAAT